MISSEVQRTLVKSPPELWAELSDPAALARHLGEFGDVRITRTEPEKTVEWTAQNTTGVVSIQPSGWGTTVKLTVTREPDEATVAPPAPTPEPQPEVGLVPVAAPPAPEPAPAPAAAAAAAAAPAAEPGSACRTESDPTPVVQLERATASEQEIRHQSRRGFFARLFGRRRTEAPRAPELPRSSDAFAAVREVLAPATLAAEHPFAALPEAKPTPAASADPPEPRAAPIGELSAELMAAEEVAAEEVTAVLTAVLDRLGAAHHRPFSRA